MSRSKMQFAGGLLTFSESFDQKVWDDIYKEIGAGWFKNRFFRFLDSDLASYDILLGDRDFTLPDGNDCKVIGLNP